MMSRPFVSSERRVDLINEFARLKTEGDQKSAASKDPDMKNPFEKKDADKKDVEKKDLKETKDDKEKEHEQYGRAASDDARHALMGDADFADEAPSNAKIGQKWADKPTKFIRREPPV
jgi:hypothetical protein